MAVQSPSTVHDLVHTLAPAMHGRSSVQFTQRRVAGSQICLNTETPTLQSAVVMHSKAQILETGPPSAASAIASSKGPVSADVSSAAPGASLDMSLVASPGSSLPSEADDWSASSCASSVESSGISATTSLAESLLESGETDASPASLALASEAGEPFESSPEPQPLTEQRKARTWPIRRTLLCMIYRRPSSGSLGLVSATGGLPSFALVASRWGASGLSASTAGRAEGAGVPDAAAAGRCAGA
jgi:hypothetical protein